jgi:dipeptidyl-peptidase 4
MADTFPRQYARTRRFSLGEPRAFRIVEPPTGSKTPLRVLFLRSRGGSDPNTCLWCLEIDPSSGAANEQLLIDPRDIGTDDGELPSEEKARRERMRETAGGITAFSTDTSGTVIACSIGGVLVTTSLISAQTIVHDSAGPGVVDPRVDPTGTRVAYLSGPQLWVLDLSTGDSRVLCGSADDPDTVSWGGADFIAAEELHRFRGYWWSPDGTQVVVQRTDDAPVATWWIADPSSPWEQPRPHRYPAAGTANPDVSLSLVDVRSGEHRPVTWDRGRYPYLTQVTWSKAGLIATLMTRHQDEQRTIRIDPSTADTAVLFDHHDERWVEVVPGVPALLGTGSLLVAIDATLEAERFGTRALGLVDAGSNTPRVITPANLQVQRVLLTTDTHAVIVAHTTAAIPGVSMIDHAVDDPARTLLLSVALATGEITVLAGTVSDAGMHDATVGWPAGHDRPTLVVRSASIDRRRAEITVVSGDGRIAAAIENLAEVALVTPRPSFRRAGAFRVPSAVLLPSDFDPGASYPVLLDPYGGPHAPRVLKSRNAFATSQWFADQGFIVLVADNRGVPGPGPEYEKAVRFDLTSFAVEDQVTALHDAAGEVSQMDLSRVAIRGWSFGGYLAALCLLRRPDVFHTAIAGAPVTDWRLYDTAYSERYLGLLDEHREAYDRSSVLLEAANLTRPMMIVHGLADDNVVVAHSLQLSSALLAAGRPHEVLPLTNVTHMTPQEEVAENLLLLQLDFLRRSLRTT